MKDAEQLAEAIRRTAALIQPTCEHWPATWRLNASTTSGNPAQHTLDTRVDRRLLISLQSSGSGSSPTDELCRLFIRVALLSRSWTNPAECLHWMNKGLLSMGFDPPLIGLTLIVLNAETGIVEAARAGLPPVVLQDAVNAVRVLSGPAPFLGISEVNYAVQTCQVVPGARLIMASSGRPDQIAAAVERRGDRSGQAFAEAVAADLLAQTDHPDGVSVLVLEHLAALRIAG